VQHLALIMDGNRRWAQAQGLASYTGHKQGIHAVKTAVAFCLEHQIRYLSLYTFSLENFKRSAQEQIYLFDLLVSAIEAHLEELQEQKIRIRFIGNRALFPAHVHTSIEKVEHSTASNTCLQINFLFCYGSRQEILAATNTLLQDTQEGKRTGAITEQEFTRYFWTADIPDPDLIIRTGKQSRLSNFLLFQAAYSELYFLDCLWPELTKEHLQKALTTYAQQQRNFGA
jgi:undecaprenyl diphosphate synthase